jgi:hypothetical protein
MERVMPHTDVTGRFQAEAEISGPEGGGSSEHHLSSCVSCDRVTRAQGEPGGTCEFCGGALRPIWGLGQLAGRRGDRDAHPEAHPGAVRETTD